METPILVALGSNIEPERRLPSAVRRLASLPFVEVVAASTVFESEPLGAPGTPLFLNAVVALETALGPRSLKFGVLREIEWLEGRRRSSDPNAPRTLDLDLVLYRDRVAQDADLRLPDPDLATQPHVVVPAAELAPNLIPPGMSEPLEALARKMRSGLVARRDVALSFDSQADLDGESGRTVEPN